MESVLNSENMNLVVHTKIALFALLALGLFACSDGKYIPGDLELHPVHFLDAFEEAAADCSDAKLYQDASLDSQESADSKLTDAKKEVADSSLK